MKACLLVSLCLLLAGTYPALAQSPVHDATREGAHALPATLDALFPPTSPMPVFLLAMHKMNTPLAAMSADLMERDAEGVQADLAAFKSAYAEAQALVPEWKDRFPQAPVDELEAALKAANPVAALPAFEKIGKVCHDCHVPYMVPVQQKYHWPSFKGIALQDPVSKEELDFVRLMQYLNMSFSAVEADLSQGQVDNARRQWQAFVARFQTLKESCEACHDSPRTYFVDAGVEATLDSMTQALAAATIDPAAVGQLGQTVGTRSCQGCHLVHMPAAYSLLAAH